MKKTDQRPNLPPVNDILNRLQPFLFDREIMVRIIRREIAQLRSDAPVGQQTRGQLVELILGRVAKRIRSLTEPVLIPVINGTGIILHTGLGRALYSRQTMETLKHLAYGYCNLEVDLSSGERNDRTQVVEELINLLTGSEAAVAVNNNAAAVLLVLNSIAKGKEVIVSRGELVEIGGSFRLPEIMESSGALLKEVGTTNKTRLSDYAKAIGGQTAMMMKVHTSNYLIEGFTESVDLSSFAALGKKKRIPTVHDLGGGSLVDLSIWALPKEPTVKESIDAGVDLVTFSGDKILGGPQAGLILGKKKYLNAIRRNPLMRALRCDKLTIALLESTLRLFLNTESLDSTHAVLRLLARSPQSIKAQAESVERQLKTSPGLKIRCADCESQAGSGTLPVQRLPSTALEITVKGLSPLNLAEKMRIGNPAVMGYVRNGKYYIDFRAVLDGQEKIVAERLLKIVTES